MSVLVTGVAGFVGSHLAARLLKDGEEVIGVDCLTDYYDTRLKRSNLAGLSEYGRFRFELVDLAAADLSLITADVSCVFHLAGQPGVRGSWGTAFSSYVRNNIIATQRLLEAIRDHPVRVVFASSSSVYGDAEEFPTPEDCLPKPTSPYGVTKLCSEQLVMAYRRSAGIDARCVRYFTVYGPGQRPDMAFSRFIAAARRGEAVEVFGDGRQVRDFTYVDDAVEATIRAASIDEAGEAIFNVGGGSTVSVSGVLATLGEILGEPIGIRHLPAQAGDVRATSADLSRIERLLGWRPAISLRDGLEAQVAASAVDS